MARSQEALRAYAGAILSHPAGATCLISNLHAEFALAEIEGTFLPLTIHHGETGNCYVCSLYDAMTRYGRYEIQTTLKNSAVRAALTALTYPLGSALRFGSVNRMVFVNNWMLSTNLYPEMQKGWVAPLTKVLAHSFPGQFIAFRSLISGLNGCLINELREAGYRFLPTRIVYFTDLPIQHGARLPKNVRLDQRMLAGSTYKVEDHAGITEQDYGRIAELYKLLYLDKYTPLNPCFTREFVAVCHRGRVLTFQGLRNPNGILDGVIGSLQIGDVITSPLLGYDTAFGRDAGLYRMLDALEFSHARKRALRIHLSAGADHFKRLRGGRQHIEYTAVFGSHLAAHRRSVLKVLEGVGERSLGYLADLAHSL